MTFRSATASLGTRGAVHLSAALLSTWPLAARWSEGLPIGREPVATVPYFNLWSLRWTAHALPGLPTGLDRWWDAPIFSPLPGMYARSELQPVTGMAFGLLHTLLSAQVAYGVLVVLALCLNGLAGNALARRLGAEPRAALVAGVLVQTVPFLFDQLGVVQLLMLWPVLFAIDQLLAWAAAPTARNAVATGTLVAVGSLTCSYHAALFAIAAVITLPLLVRRTWRAQWRRRLGTGLLGVLACCLLALPFVVGQQRRLAGTAWTAATIRDGSASWADLAPGGAHWPGAALVGLAAIGVFLRRSSRATWFIVGLVVVATLLSTGLRGSLFGWHPYEVLVDHLDAVARMRSPFRAMALAQVLLAVLAAPAIEKVWHERRVVRAIVAALVVLAVATLDLGPGPVVALPDPSTGWVDWLERHPGGSVAMMPMPVTRPVEAFEPTAAWMLLALDHGHPLLNGYTGFFPAGDREMRQRMATFPDAATVDELRARGVRYVVADPLWWTGERQQAAIALGLTIAAAGPDGTVVDLGET